MNPTCDLCGREMLWLDQSLDLDGRVGWVCPTGTPDQHRIAELESKLAAAEAELEKVKDSRATMALQNASLLTDLDQVILDRDAAGAQVESLKLETKALEAKLLSLTAERDKLRTFVVRVAAKHHECEDSWYSCPQSEEGCANVSQGEECTCWAGEARAALKGESHE